MGVRYYKDGKDLDIASGNTGIIGQESVTFGSGAKTADYTAGSYTVTKAGWYTFHAGVTIAQGSTANGNIGVTIKRNGTSVAMDSKVPYGANWNLTFSVTCTIECSEGDVITVVTSANSNNYTVVSGGKLTITRIQLSETEKETTTETVTGFKTNITAGNLGVVRYGNVIQVSWTGLTNSAAGAVFVSGLPKPQRRIDFPVFNGSNSSWNTAVILTDGTIIAGQSAMSNSWGGITYICKNGE